MVLLRVPEQGTPWNKINMVMGFLVLGYGFAAVAFYVFIAKSAKLEPELAVLSNPSLRLAAVLDMPDLRDQKAA